MKMRDYDIQSGSISDIFIFFNRLNMSPGRIRPVWGQGSYVWTGTTKLLDIYYFKVLFYPFLQGNLV